MDSTIASDVNGFKTPCKPDRVKSLLSGSTASPRTPITIPASPFMKKLGCGTGVNVYLMNRFVLFSFFNVTHGFGVSRVMTMFPCARFFRVGKLNLSPWAVKKINNKCASKQVGVYQRRLCDEANILKGLQHPNIVGKNENVFYFFTV